MASKAEEIIYNYLRKTEIVGSLAPSTIDDLEGFKRISRLNEFELLFELGFSGGIPMDQRESVRKRTLIRLGSPSSLSPEELDRHVAKYFAQAFARSKFGARDSSSGKGINETLSF